MPGWPCRVDSGRPRLPSMGTCSSKDEEAATSPKSVRVAKGASRERGRGAGIEPDAVRRWMPADVVLHERGGLGSPIPKDSVKGKRYRSSRSPYCARRFPRLTVEAISALRYIAINKQEFCLRMEHKNFARCRGYLGETLVPWLVLHYQRYVVV